MVKILVIVCCFFFAQYQKCSILAVFLQYFFFGSIFAVFFAQYQKCSILAVSQAGDFLIYPAARMQI